MEYHREGYEAEEWCCHINRDEFGYIEALEGLIIDIFSYGKDDDSEENEKWPIMFHYFAYFFL